MCQTLYSTGWRKVRSVELLMLTVEEFKKMKHRHRNSFTWTTVHHVPVLVFLYQGGFGFVLVFCPPVM